MVFQCLLYLNTDLKIITNYLTTLPKQTKLKTDVFELCLFWKNRNLFFDIQTYNHQGKGKKQTYKPFNQIYFGSFNFHIQLFNL